MRSFFGFAAVIFFIGVAIVPVALALLVGFGIAWLGFLAHYLAREVYFGFRRIFLPMRRRE